jgi:chemotaxis protein MotB
MAKKKAAAAEPAGESAPMWIVSFADLVTLMMSFFVVLYATKQGGPQQQMETAVAMASEFGWKPTPESDPQMVDIYNRRMGLPVHKENAGNGQSPDADQGTTGSHAQVNTIREGKAIVTGGAITFNVGQTDLDAASVATLREIAAKVMGKNNVLMVKGHASADESSLRPDDVNGMNLSYRRAVAVADELVKLGINRGVLRPVACGNFEPLKTGVYDAAGLRQNRRAEVFTTDNTISEFFPAKTVPAAPGETEQPGAATSPSATSHAAPRGE